jgi:hypothetical protein
VRSNCHTERKRKSAYHTAYIDNFDGRLLNALACFNQFNDGLPS